MTGEGGAATLFWKVRSGATRKRGETAQDNELSDFELDMVSGGRSGSGGGA